MNLRTLIDAGHKANGSYGSFNATLFAAIAKRKLGGVPANTLAYIRAAQEAGGGWNFAGDPTGTTATADTDTTALAIEALVAAQVKRTDPRSPSGDRLPREQPSDGWVVAVVRRRRPELHLARDDRDHRRGLRPDHVLLARFDGPALSGTPYTSPVKWLKGDQPPNGRFKSPNDSFGVNTFPTSQSIQALRRGWLPVDTLTRQTCAVTSA